MPGRMEANTEWEDTGTPYMPERYKQQIAARKRRRTVIRLTAVIVVIVACAAAFVFFFGAGHSPVPAEPGLNTPVPTTAVSTPADSSPASPTVPVTVPTNSSSSPPVSASPTPGPALSRALLSAQQETGILSYDQASSFLREDYPASSFTVVSADITGTPPEKQLYAFTIRPVSAPPDTPATTAYIDAVTGDPYSPAQDKAVITLEKAKTTINSSFTGLYPDRGRVRYTEIAGGESFWNFSLFRNNSLILSGDLDAGTGQIIKFSRTVSAAGRPAQPVLTAASARAVADRFISDHNGPVSTNMSDERYALLGTALSPVAGQYILNFERLVQSYPCDFDGFTVSVDSVSGEVTGYDRRWDDPDYAFVVSPVPSVPQRDATYTVLHKAQDTYPGLSSGISIISAEIRWKDGHIAGTTPRPGSIPLAWKIVFDDELIRAEKTPVPAVGWVDVQSGSLLEFDYTH